MGAEDNNKEKIVSEVLINQDEIYLQVKIENGALCHFRYSINGNDFKDVGKVFKAREGKWIGAKIGFYCITPNNSRDQDYIDVDWFRFTK